MDKKSRTDVDITTDSSTGGGIQADLGLLSFARDSGEPLHRQLYRQLRQKVLDGQLRSGLRIPSSRELARVTRLSRNTVITALEQLASEGFLVTRVGDGTRVAQGVARPAKVHQPPAAAMVLSKGGQCLSAPHRFLPSTVEPALFQPGVPDVQAFPRTTWARIAARRYRHLGEGLGAYAHAGGFMPLRTVIADYLRASRGVQCVPEQVLVTTTAQAGADLATRMLSDPGDKAWVENPGYIGARAAFGASGLAITPIPVDADGVDTRRILARCADSKLGYLTPSHHFPTGYTLSLDRRLELLQWTQSSGGWLIEDDYDSEFRYQNRPIAAVQGLTPETRVIYIGSFAKTLFPGLRVAYLVVPGPLAASFTQALRQTGQEPSLPLQAALHDFIAEGHFSRHVRRMRALYHARRDGLRAALMRHLASYGVPLPADGGLQLTFAFGPAGEAMPILTTAWRLGLGVEPLSRYLLPDDSPSPSGDGADGDRARGGIVFGFGACELAHIDSTIASLALALHECGRNG